MSSIFLCHSHKDKPFARKLSEKVKANGIRVWIDEAEMLPGDSLISKIESAIEEFAYLGVILSPNSVSSEWVRIEVNLALTMEIKGKRVKVLPLLYQKCNIPGFLGDKVYADFTEDFEVGFESLLARLTIDLHDEKHKQKRINEMFQVAYQDWIIFGKQDYQLLDKNRITLLLEHPIQPKISLDLIEYLLWSISYLPMSEEVDINKLKSLLHEIDSIGVAELFDRLLKHPNPLIRQRVMTLVQGLSEKNAIDAVITRLKYENVREVKRAGLRCISNLGKHLSYEFAQFLLDTDKDWLVQSYALRNLDGYRSCLLISDGTDFATELGTMAQNAGFRLVTLLNSVFSREIEEAEDENLKAHELLILVRGEHFTQYGTELFYSKLKRFVSEGGYLFATSWVSWENKHDNAFTSALPFTQIPIRESYNENVKITAKPTGSELAKKLFPHRISYRTSFEWLRSRESSIVLFETNGGIPIFGYHNFESGLCYYLNTCQHSCLGSMLSPLKTSSELHDCIQRVFEWIYETPRHEYEAVKKQNYEKLK